MPSAAVLCADRLGRTLPSLPLCRRLEPGELFLLSATNPHTHLIVRGRHGADSAHAGSLHGRGSGTRVTKLAQTTKDIAADTGLEHSPVLDGQRVAGIYRGSIMLASGRYVMLDDSMGFMPGALAIGYRTAFGAAACGDGVSWEIGR